MTATQADVALAATIADVAALVSARSGCDRRSERGIWPSDAAAVRDIVDMLLDLVVLQCQRVESHRRATGHTVERIEGRNPTPHWLRHSHVFVCHAAGMDLAQIQRRLGHADIQMTINTYGRLIDGMDDTVATRLDELLTPSTAPATIAGAVVLTVE